MYIWRWIPEQCWLWVRTAKGQFTLTYSPALSPLNYSYTITSFPAPSQSSHPPSLGGGHGETWERRKSWWIHGLCKKLPLTHPPWTPLYPVKYQIWEYLIPQAQTVAGKHTDVHMHTYSMQHLFSLPTSLMHSHSRNPSVNNAATTAV